MSTDTRPLDIAALDTGRCHLIEANAGTGKTYAMANLFLRWLLEGRRCRELLVVTFTRAATDELRGRIRRRIVEAHRQLRDGLLPEGTDPFLAGLTEAWPEGTPRQEALAHLELALFEINEAPILTIHGFCQQALTELAFDSGQPFELEQAEEDELIERALRDWWRRRTYGLDAQAAAELADRLGSYEDFARHARRLVQSPQLEPFPTPELMPQLEARLQELATHWREEREHAHELYLGGAGLDGRRHKRAGLEDALADLDHCLLQAPPAWPRAESLQRLVPDTFHFKKNANDAAREALLGLRFRAPARFLRDRVHAVELHPLAEALRAAREAVREQVSATSLELGRISFNDMITRLHQALHDGTGRADTLARNLATRYPVIMVDEFQDTDPLQYAIFSRIHRAGRAAGHSLILIGDPKQAIYAFRGGDIFTYMQARKAADAHWHLSTNWRSTAALIEAVNAVFDHPNPFAFEDIPYQPSSAPPDGARAEALRVDGEPLDAIVMEALPLNEKGERIGSKAEAEARVHDSVAGRIAWLLSRAAEGRATLGARRLEPGDIAILVRSHKQGKALREALRARGIRAVAAGRDSIWKSTEGEGLLQLLEAMLLPSDRRLQRQALAIDLLDLGYAELHDIASDPRRWAAWVELLSAAGDQWRQKGFMAGFHHLLQGLSQVLGSAETGNDWLARVPLPERTLTNLLHLADLLQAASKEHGTPERLLAWMRRQHDSDHPGEEAEPRLESDERLVKIVTIHKSKGLQYPVVFVPYLWSSPSPPPGDKSMAWHQPDNKGFRHFLCPDQWPPAEPLAERERLAEELRLTYVALTRAQSHCHLYFGSSGNSAGATALAWLFSDQAASHDLEHQAFDVGKAPIFPQRLEGHPHIRILDAQTYDAELRAPASGPEYRELHTAVFERSVRDNWQIGSFSAMTRGVHQATRAPAASGSERLALRYPAGAHVGNFLHALLERIRPDRDLGEQIQELAPKLFLRHGIPKDPAYRDLEGITAWIDDVRHTPLDAGGLTLAGLAPERQRHELEFDLGTGLINPEALNALLAEMADDPRQPLNFRAFQGMLTGAIDLVFEHEGRYFIADYKSNLLGRSLPDYRPERLQREILDRHYDLQYLIYSLALHRHLQQRLPGYDYERDFGGVYYLFLRAMQPRHGPRYGIFFARPDADLLQRLDHELIGGPGRRVA